MQKNKKSLVKNSSVLGAQGQTRVAVASQSTEIHQGPLPHPSVLEKYETIYPGAAKIIIEGMQKEQKHRHSWENNALELEMKALEKASNEAKLGKFLSAALGALCLVGAMFSLYLGSEIGAALFLSVPVLGVLKKLASPYVKKK